MVELITLDDARAVAALPSPGRKTQKIIVTSTVCRLQVHRTAIPNERLLAITPLEKSKENYAD